MNIDKNKIFEEYPDLTPDNNRVNLLAALSHDIAKSKGWWDSGAREFTSIIALIHSEISEAFDSSLKAIETGEEQFDDHLPDQSGLVTELADTVIRIFDYFGWYNYDIEMAIKQTWLGGSKETSGHQVNALRVKHITNTFSLNNHWGNQVFVFLGKCHSQASAALEANRKNDDVEVIIENFTRLVINCFVFCNNRFGEGVLESVIIQKLNYNMHRKPLHGKKY